MEYIQRKKLLYRTKVEYGDYAVNHVFGCTHGCKYPCYAMMMAKSQGRIKAYTEWIKPRLVENSLELLEKEIPRLKHKIDSVHLCFSTDPFMFGQKKVIDLSIKIIRKLNDHDIKCTALTKGIFPKEIEATNKELNKFGITLVSLREEFRTRFEPGTAPFQERIKSLLNLSQLGFKTWVSIEPYPTPNIITQSLLKILDSISFADEVFFGRLNYNSLTAKCYWQKQFYNDAAEHVVGFCQNHNKKYFIKEKTIT